MFKGDSITLLFELMQNTKTMFIMLEKNPVFFSILGMENKVYQSYQNTIRHRLIEKNRSKVDASTIAEQSVQREVTRRQQASWRRALEREMFGYTQNDGEVFCPFTYITANVENLSALFVASHIKGFSDPNTKEQEKYDINNGLLLSANADALFDSHLITINEDKTLRFSFLLEKEGQKLIQQLLLMQPIFTPILNDKRMEYISYHRKMFEQKEMQRKTPQK